MTDAPDPVPIDGAEPIPPPRKPGIPGPEATAWERRDDVGWWPAYKETMIAVVTDPIGFFRGLDPTVERYDGAILHMIHLTAGMVVGALLQILFLGAIFGIMGAQQTGAPVPALPALLGVQGGAACGLAMLGPVFALFTMLVYAGCTHLALLALGHARHGFSQTVRGTFYAFCPYALCVVPLGNYVAGVWTMVLVAIFAREFHRAPVWAAIVAAVWPLALICCLGFSAIAVAIGMAIAAN